MSKAHLRDLKTRTDTRPLLDTSKQSSAWSVGGEPRVASRQSLDSMSPEELARLERKLLYPEESRSRRSSIRSMEDLKWASSTRQSPAGDMFEMKDFFAARPITPTVATTRFQTSTPVQAYRDLDHIGKRTYRPAESIAAAMPWPDNVPRRAPQPDLSMEQLIATPSRREPSFNLLNTPLADQPIPRLPPPPVPTAGARKRGVWPSRTPSEP